MAFPHPRRIGENVENNQVLVLHGPRFVAERVEHHDKDGCDRCARYTPYVESQKLAFSASSCVKCDRPTERAEALLHKPLSEPTRVSNLGEEYVFVGVYFLLQRG